MPDRIDFSNNINESVQVGDELYYLVPPSTTPIKAGPSEVTCTITSVGKKHIIVDSLETGLTASSTFFMFLKPEHTNTNLPNGGYTNAAGLKGYYAEVQFTNSSTNPQELFAVGSEITISSK